jgi:hypothetical protein
MSLRLEITYERLQFSSFENDGSGIGDRFKRMFKAFQNSFTETVYLLFSEVDGDALYLIVSVLHVKLEGCEQPWEGPFCVVEISRIKRMYSRWG